MSNSGTARTLYDDWQQRRRRLERAGGAENPYQVPQVKVLEYLLSRYQDSPAAQRPARFQLHSHLCWDDRRILVHQHLGRGQVGGVKSREEAERRVSSVLQRMASHYEEVDQDSEAEEPEEEQYGWSPDLVFAWRAVIRKIRREHYRRHYEIRGLLLKCPFAPSAVLLHLETRLSDVSSEDEAAWELLCMCRNRTVLDHAVGAWRRRVIDGQADDRMRKEMEEYFRDEQQRELAAEKMREQLAHEDASVRLGATRLLGQIGSLEDIGLLSDLLSLPQAGDEHQHERPAMVRAMQQIAESH